MNIFAIIRDYIIDRLSKIKDVSDSGLLNKIIVDSPNNSKNGDLYTNAALILSKYLNSDSFILAEIFAKELAKIDQISIVTVVKPGFINFNIKKDLLYSLLKKINLFGIDYGNSNLGNNEKVNIEFVSANPTGPLHIGHARGAVFSDVLAKLLEKVGYFVTREYYINDAGSQINILAQSAYLRYKEALGNTIEIGDGLYPGEYLKPLGESLVRQYGDSLLNMNFDVALDIIKKFSVKSMLQLIKDDLLSLGIEHDVFVSELSLHQSNKIEESIDLLFKKKLIYYGVLEKPKGSEISSWVSREQMLFKSTEFGDDVDRPLTKEDGSWTYFAADVAYHFDKISRGFKFLILELGIDHAGYVKRLKAIVKALSDDKVNIEIKLHNVVNFFEGGVAVKMSKRKGKLLTVADVLEKVNKDIIRFIMLTRRHDMVLDFDFFKVKEQCKDNPIFYIQYACARANSLIRKYTNVCFSEDIDLSLLSSESELSLIKLLAKWPNIVEGAATNCEPHRISFYLIQVAEFFHGLWGYGNNNSDMRFIVEKNQSLTHARIFLVKAVLNVLASGLSIFNIVPLQEMR